MIKDKSTTGIAMTYQRLAKELPEHQAHYPWVISVAFTTHSGVQQWQVSAGRPGVRDMLSLNGMDPDLNRAIYNLNEAITGYLYSQTMLKERPFKPKDPR
jgi:hypothetical protein